jgi:hypothetical protein
VQVKALKITLTHGRIWTAETSSGARSQAASLGAAVEKLVPISLTDRASRDDFERVLGIVFDGIPDSGGDGNIGRGVKSG